MLASGESIHVTLSKHDFVSHARQKVAEEVRMPIDCVHLITSGGNMPDDTDNIDEVCAGVTTIVLDHKDPEVIAVSLDCEGKVHLAEPWYKKAIQSCEESLGSHHPDTIRCYKSLADCLMHQDKFQEAEQWYRKAAAPGKELIIQGLGDRQTLEQVMVYDDIAACLHGQGKAAEAARWERFADTWHRWTEYGGTSRVIGPNGGIVTSDDANVMIEVPPNAVRSRELFSAYPQKVSDLPEGFLDASAGDRCSDIYEMGPADYDFLKPVLVCLAIRPPLRGYGTGFPPSGQDEDPDAQGSKAEGGLCPCCHATPEARPRPEGAKLLRKKHASGDWEVLPSFAREDGYVCAYVDSFCFIWVGCCFPYLSGLVNLRENNLQVIVKLNMDPANQSTESPVPFSHGETYELVFKEKGSNTNMNSASLFWNHWKGTTQLVRYLKVPATPGTEIEVFRGDTKLGELSPSVDSLAKQTASVLSSLPGRVATVLNDMTSQPTCTGTIHATFASEDGLLLAQVNERIRDAGMIPTALHCAQTSKWFQAWSEKLFQASGVVILYTKKYREKFHQVTALRQEANAILKKCEADPSFLMYVLDPHTEHASGVHHTASDVCTNLQRHASVMGDIEGWQKFVKTHVTVQNFF